MRRDLVEKAEKAESEALGLPWPPEKPPEGEPEALPRAQSGVLRVQSSRDVGRARSKPWKVKGDADAYVCRVASVAEGAAIAQAYASAGDKLKGATPKAMRRTVQRLARQTLDGQLPLQLGDGLDGEG